MAFFALHRRAAFLCGTILAMATFTLLVTGCAVPVWLLDAEGIGAVLVTAAGSITSFIAAMTGNVALAAVAGLIATWGQKVEAGLVNVNSLIESYKKSPNATLLQQIEQVAQTVVGDINSLGQIEGIPAAVLTPIQAMAQSILTELESLISLLPLAGSPAAGSIVAVKVPTLTADFKAKFNTVLTVPTGDTNVDAVLASVKPL